MKAIKVLIVDDSLFFREILSRRLISRLPKNSQIDTAGEPLEARDKILSFDPDVMVLDVEMPQMNGIEFLRRLMVQQLGYEPAAVYQIGSAVAANSGPRVVGAAFTRKKESKTEK